MQEPGTLHNSLAEYWAAEQMYSEHNHTGPKFYHISKEQMHKGYPYLWETRHAQVVKTSHLSQKV